MTTALPSTLDLRSELEAARRSAGRAYVAEGCDAYSDELLNDLALLIAATDAEGTAVQFTFSELLALQRAGLLSRYHRLTVGGRSAAAAAAIARTA